MEADNALMAFSMPAVQEPALLAVCVAAVCCVRAATFCACLEAVCLSPMHESGKEKENSPWEVMCVCVLWLLFLFLYSGALWRGRHFKCMTAFVWKGEKRKEGEEEEGENLLIYHSACLSQTSTTQN